MIVVENLSLRVGRPGHPSGFALDGLSLRVPTGAHGILMGRTGCGKTTLLEAICGLKPATCGKIELGGRDVTGLPASQRGVGYVPQDLALFPTMTVADQIAFALTIRKRGADAIRQRVAELADLLGISHLLTRKPAGLSGGEGRRVALGRALSFDPPVLLLDEPLTGLDDETRDEMYALLESVRKRTGVTVLHVTHSRSDADRLGGHIFVLRDGVIREEPSKVGDASQKRSTGAAAIDVHRPS
jgi:molybdate/tungstate transport system ATP-binding protein